MGNKDLHPQWGEFEFAYYARYGTATYSIFKHEYNEKTKKWVRIPQENDNGNHKRDGNGNKLYVEEDIKFVPYSRKNTDADNFSWSFYKVFKNTPPYIKDYLKKLLDTGELYLEIDKIKQTDPKLGKVTEQNMEIKKENEKLLRELEALKAKK